jgi:hypothetical protein
MKIESPLIAFRLLYLYENYIHNFEDRSTYVNNALTYSLEQIKSSNMGVKKKAITSLTALIKTTKVYVPISTFEELAAIAKNQVANLLKCGSLTLLLESLVTLLPSWKDKEDRVKSANEEYRGESLL